MTAIISNYTAKAATPKGIVPKARKITRARMDQSQTIKVYEALKEALKPADKGLFTYVNNLSDAKIAARLGVTERNVYSTRLKLFGKLKYDGEYVPYSVLLQKFNDLNTRLASLEQQLGVSK